MKVKVENEKSLVRDMNNRAILNNDKEALIKHRQMKNSIKKDKERIKSLEERMERLERLLNEN